MYQKSEKRPIELTSVVRSQINPWVYPPICDFQYGDWLREDFEQENFDSLKKVPMPDLAILVIQLRLAHKNLFGAPALESLPQVPLRGFLKATNDAVVELIKEVEGDTRNTLLLMLVSGHCLKQIKSTQSLMQPVGL